MADFVQNDTASILSLTLQDQSGKAIDLTGATVTLQYYIDTNPPLFTKTMSIVSPSTNGVCQYQFGVTSGTYDLATAGTMHFTVTVALASGAVVSSPFEGQITIHPAWPLTIV